MAKFFVFSTLFVLLFCAVPLSAQDDSLQKALVLSNEGKTEEAINVLKGIVDKNPQSSKALVALGILYLQQNQYALSEKTLENAVALDPQSIPVYYTLAMLYENQKKYERAMAMWIKVIALSAEVDVRQLAEKHLQQLKEIAR